MGFDLKTFLEEIYAILMHNDLEDSKKIDKLTDIVIHGMIYAKDSGAIQ